MFDKLITRVLPRKTNIDGKILDVDDHLIKIILGRIP